MDDEKAAEPCGSVKKEEDLSTDDRAQIGVDDKLIGDDLVAPALMPPNKNDTTQGKDAVY